MGDWEKALGMDRQRLRRVLQREVEFNPSEVKRLWIDWYQEECRRMDLPEAAVRSALGFAS